MVDFEADILRDIQQCVTYENPYGYLMHIYKVLNSQSTLQIIRKMSNTEC